MRRPSYTCASFFCRFFCVNVCIGFFFQRHVVRCPVFCLSPCHLAALSLCPVLTLSSCACSTCAECGCGVCRCLWLCVCCVVVCCCVLLCVVVCACVWLWCVAHTLKITVYKNVQMYMSALLCFCSLTFHNGFMFFFASRKCFMHFSRLQATPLLEI